MLFFSRFLSRIAAFKAIDLADEASGVRLAKTVQFRTKPTSKILISGGTLTVGYPLDEEKKFAAFTDSVITLGSNSVIRIMGDVIIAPGATIRVEDGAELILAGRNIFAHNLTIICKRNMTFGEGAEVSWNVTFIDDDGHTMENASGRAIRALYRPMVIGANVGIQMNALFPRGVTVGDNSIVACGTVIRRDVPQNCLVMAESSIKIKHGIRTTKQKISGTHERPHG